MSPELERFLEERWFGVDSIRMIGAAFGGTALHHAVEEEPVELVRELVCEMGDLVHHRDIFGATALHYACTVGNLDTVVLLATYINQTIQDNMGLTALFLVCGCNPHYVPLLKWHEIPTDHDYPPFVKGFHIHALAKLRRLLGTLPAAYIRLVHAYT